MKMKKNLLTLVAVILFGATLPLMAQQRKGNVRPAARTTKQVAKPTTKDVSNTSGFTLNNGKLGSIQIGQNYSSLPKSYAGLYDKYTYKKMVHESDMEDDWVEEYLLFTNNGKEVFRTGVENRKITSITLERGGSFIKTSEGFYVGCPVRELLAKKRMQWENYYEGYVFATSGHYTYYVNSDDVPNTDIPEKASDFKSTAKLMRITYM